MNVNDLLNGGCLQASFDDTLIHTSSEPLGVIPELYTSVPAPDDPINSVESPIAIDHSFDYMPPPPLPISTIPKPKLGRIGRLGSIKRTPAPSPIRSFTALPSQKRSRHHITEENKLIALQITFDFREGFIIKSNTTKTWALITEEFQKQTGSSIKSIRKLVEKELDERRDELKE